MQSNHRSLLSKPWLGALALALGLACPSTARANSPFLVVPDPAVAEASPAYRYANMTDAEAFEELDRRKIIYSKVDPVPGVRAPIRLTGRLHGVYIHSALPPNERVTSIFEILDARLALALDDFAALLEQHDIDEVVHYTMYRPNVAAPDKDGHDAADASASAAPLPGARRQRAGSKSAASPAKPAAATKIEPEKGPSEKRPLDSKLNLDKKRDAKREPKPIGRDGARGSKQKAPALAPKKPELVAPRLAPPKPSKGIAPKPAAAPVSPAASAAPVALAAKPLPAKSPAAASPAASSPVASSLAKHRTGSVASVRSAAKPFVRRGTWAPPGTRHPAGLAIDVGSLHKRDGRWLSVAQHFQGNIGDPTCGDGVTFPAQESARELHSIVCEAYALGIFTYVLTPNYNEAHADHFHMEIKAGVRWFLYH